MRSVATTVLCIVPTLVAAGALLAACEDGPNQSFSPASGTLFNNGQVDGSASFTEAGYDAGYVNKTVLTPCSPELQRLRWGAMLNNSMTPPVFFAGLDLRGCTGGRRQRRQLRLAGFDGRERDPGPGAGRRGWLQQRSELPGRGRGQRPVRREPERHLRRRLLGQQPGVFASPTTCRPTSSTRCSSPRATWAR